MAEASRRWIAWAVAAAIVAVLAAWLLRPSDEPAPRDARPDAPSSAADETTSAAKRTRRVRETAAPSAPETPEEAPTPAKPGEVPEPTIPFVVTVLRSDGTPAAGATVVLLGDDDEGDWARELARATAGVDGVAAVTAVDADVRVSAWLGAESAATGEMFAVKERHEVTVRLGPSIVVRGRVLRGDSAPEAGAAVELDCGPWFGSEFGLSMKVRTDAAGRFEFPAFPVAGIDPLNPPCVEAITRDMARGYAEADLARPDAELVVHLKPGFTVRGRFVDGGGKPVAAELSVAGARRYHATAGADGRVALRVPEAKFDLVASRDTELFVKSSRAKRSGGNWIVSWRIGRSLGAHEDGAGDVDLGDVVIPAGRPVKGRVVDSTGRPAANADVVLYLGAVDLGSVDTDSDGRFGFPEVGDAPHRLYVRTRPAEPGAPGDRSAEVQNVRGGDADVRVVLEDMLVIGFKFLSEADRRPLECSKYSIRVKLHGEGYDWFGTEVAGDESDFAAVEVFTPGSYDVEVNVSGYEPVRFESIEVAAGRPRSLDLLLRKKHE
jgi:hypothetical protein